MLKRLLLVVAAVLAGVTFVAPAQATPTARFTWGPTQRQTGQTVTFDGRASFCDRGPCTYTWTDSGGPLGASPSCVSPCSVLTTKFNFAETKHPALVVRNRWRQTSSVTHDVVVVAPPPPTPTPTPTPGVLWTADADTPGTWDVSASDAGPEWASTSERSDRPNMVQRVCDTGEARQGPCTYKFVTDPGDGGPFDTGRNVVRAELAQGNPTRVGFENRLTHQGDDVYYGFYIKRQRFPCPTSAAGQQGGLQIKGAAPSGAPLVETHLWEDRCPLQVSFNNWHSEENGGDFRRAGPLGNHVEESGDVWYRWVLRVRYDLYPNGIIQWWWAPDDGSPLTQVTDDQQAETMMADLRPDHVRIGIYGGDDGISHRVVYIDGFTAGTTFESVAPS